MVLMLTDLDKKLNFLCCFSKSITCGCISDKFASESRRASKIRFPKFSLIKGNCESSTAQDIKNILLYT